ncbi:hypothetical protein AMELA_G00247180 [Ameiurus melas]|uniref:Uncharacterized protein n=1 Tax=Ameiurus melas TaxID=219545 RepID=A0A7J5ZTI5_AMEME|nr:hypothetical protein AMELA_G00247180 [Ameiurus melas]
MKTEKYFPAITLHETIHDEKRVDEKPCDHMKPRILTRKKQVGPDVRQRSLTPTELRGHTCDQNVAIKV